MSGICKINDPKTESMLSRSIFGGKHKVWSLLYQNIATDYTWKWVVVLGGRGGRVVWWRKWGVKWVVDVLLKQQSRRRRQSRV